MLKPYIEKIKDAAAERLAILRKEEVKRELQEQEEIRLRQLDQEQKARDVVNSAQESLIKAGHMMFKLTVKCMPIYSIKANEIHAVLFTSNALSVQKEFEWQVGPVSKISDTDTTCYDIYPSDQLEKLRSVLHTEIDNVYATKDDKGNIFNMKRSTGLYVWNKLEGLMPALNYQFCVVAEADENLRRQSGWEKCNQ